MRDIHGAATYWVWPSTVLTTKRDVWNWHICDLWRRLNEGCLRQQSGRVTTAAPMTGFDP